MMVAPWCHFHGGLATRAREELNSFAKPKAGLKTDLKLGGEVAWGFVCYGNEKARD
ncbi:hypothetical protein COEX109129_06225 [Corallococcus exiguus]